MSARWCCGRRPAERGCLCGQERVLLGAVVQGPVVWESTELTYIPQEETQLWLHLEMGTGDAV